MTGTTPFNSFEPRILPPIPALLHPAATMPGMESGGDGDSDFPGGTPDEVQPQQEPATNPGQVPDEVSPGQGDDDEPDSSPDETPEPQETPSAPD